MADEKFDLKKEYEILKSKYKLPDFNILNNEFEISSIDKKDFLLKLIRRKMNDKLIMFCRIIENIVFPSSQNPFTNYESTFFDENKRKQLLKLHKKLMIYERQSLLLDITPDDMDDADYIKDLTKEWSDFKKETHETVKEMQKSWHTEAKDEEEDYFG